MTLLRTSSSSPICWQQPMLALNLLQRLPRSTAHNSSDSMSLPIPKPDRGEKETLIERF